MGNILKISQKKRNRRETPKRLDQRGPYGARRGQTGTPQNDSQPY